MSLFFLAIAAGFLTILAPCILPVLPFLLGTGAGRSRWRPLAVVGGFVLSFSVIGAAFATAGSFLGLGNDALRVVAGIVLACFGLALVFEGVYDRVTARVAARFASAGARISGGAATRTDALSGVLVGLSLGLVWTPCAGPILGTILTLASRTKDFVTVALLFFAYSLGSGVPMLAIAYGSRGLVARLKGAGRLQPVLTKVFGVLILLTAVAILTGYDRVAQTWLVQYYPAESILKL